jgi:hypothetical protein
MSIIDVNFRIDNAGVIGNLRSQIPFASAVALTKTAKHGQTAVLSKLRENFEIRNNWAEPSSKFGVKITPAKKNDLKAEVYTRAGWMAKQEAGGTHLPRQKALAVPTENVKRNKKQIIPRAQRPGMLRTQGSFILQTKRGGVIAMRKKVRKRSELTVLYGLEPSVKIKARPFMRVPVESAVDKHLSNEFNKALVTALKTAR